MRRRQLTAPVMWFRAPFAAAWDPDPIVRVRSETFAWDPYAWTRGKARMQLSVVQDLQRLGVASSELSQAAAELREAVDCARF